jgi:hypothetical protein
MLAPVAVNQRRRPQLGRIEGEMTGVQSSGSLQLQVRLGWAGLGCSEWAA